MTISASFLKKYGVTKTAFYKFVKGYNSLTVSEDSVAQKLAEKHDITSIWGGLFETDAVSANSCCGVCEISLEDNSDIIKSIKEGVVHGLLKGHTAFIYYSIQKKYDAQCREIGFKRVDSFLNKNTGNTVTVWFLKV